MLIVALAVSGESLWMILSTWWLFIPLQFHYFFHLQLNSCNDTLNPIEKTLSVLWNAFNVEMDQPISHCISQRAVQIHSREIKIECVRKHHHLLLQPFPTIPQSGKSTYSARIITHRLLCDEGRQSGGYMWMLDGHKKFKKCQCSSRWLHLRRRKKRHVLYCSIGSSKLQVCAV